MNRGLFGDDWKVACVRFALTLRFRNRFKFPAVRGCCCCKSRREKDHSFFCPPHTLAGIELLGLWVGAAVCIRNRFLWSQCSCPSWQLRCAALQQRTHYHCQNSSAQLVCWWQFNSFLLPLGLQSGWYFFFSMIFVTWT